MSDDEDQPPTHNLREALRHLGEAREGALRQTHAVAVEQAEKTIARVLQEHEQDG